MATIGSQVFTKGERKYFYKLTRTDDNDLVLTKIEVTNSQGESIELQDPTEVSAETQHQFRGFNTDYTYVNMFDSNTDSQPSPEADLQDKDLIDPPLGVTQYLVRTEDMTFTINQNGEFIITVDG
jgi:hypothetical protein